MTLTVHEAKLPIIGASAAQADTTQVRLSPWQAFAPPLALSLSLIASAGLDPVRQNPTLLWSFLGAGATLLAWNIVLFGFALRRGRTLALQIAARKQHYLQAFGLSILLLYWGWHWPQVYESAHLIAAQLVFAYAFDMLLGWSRRDTYVLGFGPFPVVFSINLFFWFKDDWFYFQFLMVALGFAAKGLIHWERDGRRTHIFNPSSVPLAVFSLALILTGMSDLTWGAPISITQFYPPQMYLVIFLIGLPGQFFFGVAPMTIAAVLTTYLFGLLYFAATGTYFFVDSYIPISVFLGMHFLFTDPSTSPRTELGRLAFGILYGLSTVALYALLEQAGVPSFYDKLLQMPILNLSVKLIDRAARSKTLSPFDPTAIGRSLTPRGRHLAYMSLWAGAFALMSGAQGVGDSHRGQWAAFWQQACNEGRQRACTQLADMQLRHCRAGSGWACNEHGLLQARRDRDVPAAGESMRRGCELGFLPACGNATRVRNAGRLESAPPTLDDYPIIVRGSKRPITDRSPAALYARACRAGWSSTCGRAEVGRVGDFPDVRPLGSIGGSSAR